MERTYVFNQEPSSGGGNKFDIMAMLPNLMGGKGVDPNLMALLSQGRNNQDQWGGSWWFIWIILLWFCWGGIYCRRFFNIFSFHCFILSCVLKSTVLIHRVADL